MSDPHASAVLIRPAREADAAPLLEIYRPFVEETAVSFETVTPTVDEFAGRIRKALEGWQWLVAEAQAQCVGYAYGSTHRERAAYRLSVEVSAYVAPSHRGRGIGKCLYTQLLDELAARGYCNAFGGLTLPNDASMALHRSVGFAPIGVFPSVGRKFDRWHDVAWLHKRIRAEPP